MSLEQVLPSSAQVGKIANNHVIAFFMEYNSSRCTAHKRWWSICDNTKHKRVVHHLHSHVTRRCLGHLQRCQCGGTWSLAVPWTINWAQGLQRLGLLRDPRHGDQIRSGFLPPALSGGPTLGAMATQPLPFGGSTTQRKMGRRRRTGGQKGHFARRANMPSKNSAKGCGGTLMRLHSVFGANCRFTRGHKQRS